MTSPTISLARAHYETACAEARISAISKRDAEVAAVESWRTKKPSALGELSVRSMGYRSEAVTAASRADAAALQVEASYRAAEAALQATPSDKRSAQAKAEVDQLRQLARDARLEATNAHNDAKWTEMRQSQTMEKLSKLSGATALDHLLRACRGPVGVAAGMKCDVVR